MNTQVGKSVGIALLMAAALIAALFAMGVFAPVGLDANTKSNPATTAMLDKTTPGATDATLTVKFQVNDAIDGAPTATQDNDNVTITVPTAIAVITAGTYDASKVTVTQGGNPVGKVVTPVATDQEIVITVADAGKTNVMAHETVTVTIPGLTLASDAATASVEIEQTGQADAVTTATAASVSIFDPNAALTAASASVGDESTTLLVKFTAKTAGSVMITVPSTYLVNDANVAVSGGSATRTVATATGVITIETVAQNDTITVTIDRLSNLAVDDEIKIEQTASNYSATLIVGGASVSPRATAGAAGDTEAVLGKGGNKADALATLKLADLVATANIAGGNDIVVSLPGFQIPDRIDDVTVIIDGGVDTAFYGNPASVSVSGSNITLSLPTRTPAGAVIGPITSANNYTITFKQSAGIKNPNSAGIKTITVRDNDPVADNHEMMVEIISHVSVAPKWVERGDSVTVTGKGINPSGTVTVHLYEGDMAAADLTGSDLTDSMVLGAMLMDAGTAMVEIVTSSSRFEAEAKDATTDDDAMGTNVIAMVDAAGKVVGTALVGIKPTVTLDVSEVRRSGKMKVSISDWYYGREVSSITVNGIQVLLPDGNDDDSEADSWAATDVADFPLDVIVDRDVRLGTMEVAVHGSSYVEQGSNTSLDIHKQTVNVGVFDLSVSPSTAVTDQVIRLEGTGFLSRACITSIMVGEQSIMEATSGDDVGTDRNSCVDTDSNGKLADSFNVPFGLSPGTYRLVVRDEGNRVGEADLVIPKPAITLDPIMGQRGDTVVVVGKNFPAEDLVTVRYRGVAVASSSTDTVGNWRATFTVPITAPIGAKHEVMARSENKGDGSTVDNVERATLSAKATHEVPDETLELSPDTVAAGGRLTVTGGNLPLFTPVTVRIGGIAAAGRAIGEDDASDGSGRYERVILVPQLTPGTHTVELTAHARNEDISVARFVVIDDSITRPTDEVFGDLIEAGQLASVWRYRIDETGSDWDSFDPQFVGQEGINDLELVSTNDIVWIRVTSNVADFQGSPLYEGWNLRTLE